LSNRQIAETLKVDDKTVGNVRAKLETTAEIPQLKSSKGKDGKVRTTKRKRSSVFATDKAQAQKAFDALVRISVIVGRRFG